MIQTGELGLRRSMGALGLSLAVVVLCGLAAGCAAPTHYDVVIRGGTIYDGSGADPLIGDVAIRGDGIVAVGDIGRAVGELEVDARDLAVAPGFVNMMCWANESLIEDGRSQSDIRQGVTLEVMGEGMSMGPLSDELKTFAKKTQSDIRYDIEWTTLGEYLEFLERRGVSPNVASFIGAANPRMNVIGFDDRPATPEELEQMAEQVRQAMEEGALGVASSLIYPPGSFADTAELIELVRAVAPYGGMYISHMRSEGDQLLEAVDELLTIARETGVRTEIYHLKAAGQTNWPKMDQVIATVEQAQAEGLEITADMYTYTAGSTGLISAMPAWVQDGGYEEALERLQDPATRRRIADEMDRPSDQWENLYLGCGSPDNILLVGFASDELKPLTGKTVAEVAEMRGTSPEETIMDLVLEDQGGVSAVYFMMTEDNLSKQIALPWVSFCSDSPSLAPEGVFLESSTHPRAYGSFARLLAKYVRDQGVIPLPEAIRRLTSLPAETIRADRRGRLQEGYFADVVVFDPETIQDHATYQDPHQYATGMVHVFVNGAQVLADGEHTGATPGRFVRGPGWKPRSEK
jgi:N-acyl-D-amino-acid deacylase